MEKPTIIVASSNKGKIKEIKEIFNEFEIVTLQEIEEKLQKKIEITENGKTFSENALQKAMQIAEQIEENTICMGDDSGLSIDALDGFPGIHTQRWLKADDHTKNLALLEKMREIPQEQRTCHYTTAIAIANKNKSEVVECTLDGYIAQEAIGENGFGFDEIFTLKNGKTLAQITSEEKYKISPRKKALQKIKKTIKRG